MKRSTACLIVLVLLLVLELLVIAYTGPGILNFLMALLTLAGIYYMLGLTVTEPSNPKGNGEYRD